MEAAYSSETYPKYGNTETTWYHIPEECDLNIHHHKNIKSQGCLYAYVPCHEHVLRTWTKALHTLHLLEVDDTYTFQPLDL
jgi:hypothetical protein